MVTCILVHGFEQRRLRLGRRAIDLVGQQEMREHRTRLELEFLRYARCRW